MEFKTKASGAKRGTDTLRTTIPIKITELLNINKGDEVIWGVDKDKEGWIVKVKKGKTAEELKKLNKFKKDK